MNRKEQIEKATPSYIKEKYSHLDHSFIEVDNNKKGKQEAFREGAKWADEHPYWHKTSEELPNDELGEVLGYSPNWINEDFTPDGIRVCFLSDDGWVSAMWSNEHDCYDAVGKGWYSCIYCRKKDCKLNGAPEYWMEKPKFNE